MIRKAACSRKIAIAMAVVCLLGAGAFAGEFADVVPEGSFAYVGTPNVKELREAWEKTPLNQLWMSPSSNAGQLPSAMRAVSGPVTSTEKST